MRDSPPFPRSLVGLWLHAEDPPNSPIASRKPHELLLSASTTPHRVIMAKKGTRSILYAFGFRSLLFGALTTPQGTPPMPPSKATRLTRCLHSEVPHHHGAPHFDGHDGLLPDSNATARSPTVEHDEI